MATLAGGIALFGLMSMIGGALGQSCLEAEENRRRQKGAEWEARQEVKRRDEEEVEAREVQRREAEAKAEQDSYVDHERFIDFIEQHIAQAEGRRKIRAWSEANPERRAGFVTHIV